MSNAIVKPEPAKLPVRAYNPLIIQVPTSWDTHTINRKLKHATDDELVAIAATAQKISALALAELRVRFGKLESGATIGGCATWTEMLKKLGIPERTARHRIAHSGVENPAKMHDGSKSRKAKAASKSPTPNKAAGDKPPFAIAHSPIDDSETWAKEDASRRIVSWTLSCLKGFSLIERRQIVDDVIAKLRDELAFEAADAHRETSPPTSTEGEKSEQEDNSDATEVRAALVTYGGEPAVCSPVGGAA